MLASRLFAILLLATACQLAVAQSAENPSLSVVGDVAGRYGFADSQPLAGAAGVELQIQSPIDPFAQANFIFHYSTGLLEAEHEAELDLEEANVTFTSLPGGLQLSAGRMRSTIGIVNVQHLHDFNFVDYPKIVTGFWGEEGLSVDGARASWLAPLPFWTEFVLEGQKALGDEQSDLATGGLHLFFPFGDDHGLSVTGFAEADRQQGDDSVETPCGLHGLGGGLRYKWEPPSRALYTHLLLQAEFQNRNLEGQSYSGLYGMAEYKFCQQWTAGVMFERAALPSESSEDQAETTTGLSVALSFWPSEFQRIRLQYDHPLQGDEDDQRLTLAGTFIIGPHKPHSY